MATATARAPVIGDNARPLLTVDALKMDHADMEALVVEWEKKGETVPTIFEDDEDLDAAKAMAPELRKVTKRIDGRREDVKAPFLDAGNVAQSHFKTLEARINAVLAKHQTSATAYLKRKADRARVEQEQREAAEREAAAQLTAKATAQASGGDVKAAVETQTSANAANERADRASQLATGRPADLARTTTTAGTSTLVNKFSFKIEDYSKLPPATLWSYLSPAEMNAVVTRFVNAGGRELAGVRIFPDPQARL